ncbi:hypothetical protein [Pimelobacter simplex]|uniref:hypothetical protein n=1 Tax=Nocardioides simplex TaxID=2045 RepID=UPI0021503941|nr:hypothetical protein [Pimelobacter simplex]UUW92670.1 hypothetical protein M0M43_14660 [Pimelobacter simplex]UUW96498.1 hypothetical protein M0M48_03295 [Pimelobacter simplex]
MAKLKRMQYDVLLDDGTEDGVEHRVVVIHGDMIRGEQAARGRKLPADAHIDRGSIYVYCAMKRQQITDKPYGEWIDTVLAMEPVDDGNGNPELVAVDPTSAPSDSL